jgi:hypothetical protein
MTNKSFCSCQHHLHNPRYDRARPSCWNCEQNSEQCLYPGNETSIVQEQDCQSPETPEEPDLSCTPWLDSLRDHPYYDLEGNQKMGLVGTWYLKLRHCHPLKTVFLESLEKPVMGRTAEVDNESLLSRDSLDQSDDETSPIADDTEHDTSLMNFSTTTLVYPFPQKGPPSSSCTVPLDLDMVLSLGTSTKSQYPAKESLLSSGCDLQALWGKEIDDKATKDFSDSQTLQGAQNCFNISPRSFHCIFCLERFEEQKEWKEHEQSQHFMTQRDWICMPSGPVEESIGGQNICVFCGTADPSSSHQSQHRTELCSSRPVEDRTYRNKEDFLEHLRCDHGQYTMTDCMEDWSYPLKDDAWYWRCGFCDTLLARWDDRVAHIGDHFKEGKAMSSWDLLIPPYPFDKSTGTYLPWLSPKDKGRGTLSAFWPESPEVGK